MKRFVAIPLIVLLFTVFLAPLYAGQITERAAKPYDVYQLRKELVYTANHVTLSAAGVGSATTYMTVTNTPVVVVNNTHVTLTATNTIEFSSGHIALDDAEMCYFGLCADSSGDYSTIQGPIVTNSAYLKVPMPDTGKTLIGLIKVVCDNPGVFTPNTTSVAAPASATITISDVYTLPVSLDMSPR